MVILTPDTPDVERVLLGQQGIVAGLRPGTLVIDMSISISLTETARFAEAVRAGGSYLDAAPVSGVRAGAGAASLTIMVGGAQADFDRAAGVPLMARTSPLSAR